MTTDTSAAVTALQQALIRDPVLALNVSQMHQTLVMDQTIMLAIGMGYRELETLKDELYEDDLPDLIQPNFDSFLSFMKRMSSF